MDVTFPSPSYGDLLTGPSVTRTSATGTEYSLTDPNYGRSLLDSHLVILAHAHGEVLEVQLGVAPGGLVAQAGEPPEVGAGLIGKAHPGGHGHQPGHPQRRQRRHRLEHRGQRRRLDAALGLLPGHVHLDEHLHPGAAPGTVEVLGAPIDLTR